ncbi:MAG: hypothetical protein ABW170_07970 [Candidatus Thiodiazotropha sp. L084R]
MSNKYTSDALTIARHPLEAGRYRYRGRISQGGREASSADSLPLRIGSTISQPPSL